jgi:hypothetical protein
LHLLFRLFVFIAEKGVKNASQCFHFVDSTTIFYWVFLIFIAFLKDISLGIGWSSQNSVCPFAVIAASALSHHFLSLFHLDRVFDLGS